MIGHILSKILFKKAIKLLYCPENRGRTKFNILILTEPNQQLHLSIAFRTNNNLAST